MMGCGREVRGSRHRNEECSRQGKNRCKMLCVHFFFLMKTIVFIDSCEKIPGYLPPFQKK